MDSEAAVGALSVLLTGNGSSALDLESLRTIQDLLQSPSSPNFALELDAVDDFVEQDFLSSTDLDAATACEEDENPYPKWQPADLCEDQLVLNKFTCYVFDRRFGWSEAKKEGGMRVRRMSCTGATIASSDGHQKALIIDILDNLIHWFSHQRLNLPMLESFRYTLKQVSDMPVVRNRTVVHVMEWFKRQWGQLGDSSLAHSIKDLLVTSLTDVWSAIRNACASRLSAAVDGLALEDLQSLFNDLVQICKNDDSPWQAKEGAIMGINAIIRQFQEKITSGSKTVSHDLECPDTKLQSPNTDVVPEFISKQIHGVVFSLLSHPQLTIRENAGKSLSTYVLCSDVSETLSTFEQVISLLRNGLFNSNQTEICCTKKQPIQFLDAYAAEGFLGVCIFLIKVLPLSHTLPQWPLYLSTFQLYLSHPASTVRQAASNVFKYLVSKASHSAVLLKLILQSLTEDWYPDMQHLSQTDAESHVSECNGVIQRPSVCDNSYNKLSDTWESREGRLFAFELILKFLIKNHWLYTFGPAGSGGSNMNTWQSSSGDCSWLLRGKQQENDDSEVDYSSSMPENRLRSELQKAVHFSGVEDVGTEAGPSAGTDLQHSDSDQSFTVRFVTEDRGANIPPGINKKFERMATVDESMMHKTEGPAHPSRATAPHNSQHIPGQFETTFSILMQAQVLDKMDTKVLMKEHSCSKQQFQIQSLKKSLVPSESGLSSRVSWVDKVQVQDMSEILQQIMYQTVESLGDCQWELRRMGQQVFPCLAEVIRWFDIGILEHIWDQNLSPISSLRTFSATVLLKESVIHAVKLMPLLQRPPMSWQDQDTCRKIILKIVNCMNERLPSYLPLVNRLLQRPCYDRLSVMAAHTIITAHNYFNIPEEQKCVQTTSLMTFWRNLFCHAHPNTRISKELLATTEIKIFNSPFEGYLSCCLVKPDSKVHCAKQVEKFFVSEIHGGLVDYLKNIPLDKTVFLLPILGHYVGLLVGETHICKTLSECLNVFVTRTMEFVNGTTTDQVKNSYLKFVHLTLKELAAIITMKSADLHLVQKVLNMYSVLCKPINPSRHLRVIMHAICARVGESVYFNVEHSPRPEEDLSLLSNDIPLNHSTDTEEDSDQDVVIIGSPATSKFPESLTLNTSNNSGSLTSGRLSALSMHSADGRAQSPVSEQEEESSDWDSWDDEEEGDSPLNEAFSAFLQKLQKQINIGKSDVLMAEIRGLGDRERILIKNIMNW